MTGVHLGNLGEEFPDQEESCEGKGASDHHRVDQVVLQDRAWRLPLSCLALKVARAAEAFFHAVDHLKLGVALVHVEAGAFALPMIAFFSYHPVTTDPVESDYLCFFFPRMLVADENMDLDRREAARGRSLCREQSIVRKPHDLPQLPRRGGPRSIPLFPLD